MSTTLVFGVTIGLLREETVGAAASPAAAAAAAALVNERLRFVGESGESSSASSSDDADVLMRGGKTLLRRSDFSLREVSASPVARADEEDDDSADSVHADYAVAAAFIREIEPRRSRGAPLGEPPCASSCATSSDATRRAAAAARRTRCCRR